MSHKKKPNEQAPKARPEDRGATAKADAAIAQEELARLEAEDAERATGEHALAGAVAEPADQQVLRLERELAEWKDRALRAAADFENYRKRAVRERDEASGRGQAEALQRIVDVVDDLARVAHLDPAQTSSDALHEGMLAIERKFLKTLEAAGVERLDPAGKPFDPRMHEAVAALPAPSADRDQVVGAVYQHGYTFRGALLRPARVAVLTWSAPSGDGGHDEQGNGADDHPGAPEVGGEAGD
ncbi:MAG: nucleotide exchange factor GrpE [Gemmatimonadales bacterium]